MRRADLLAAALLLPLALHAQEPEPKNQTGKQADGKPTKAQEVPGFSYLREETFSLGGQTHTVKVYRNEAFAKALGVAAGETDVACEFVLVPGGTFSMGSPDGEAERTVYEGPQHEVTVKPFLVARTEVTQAVWQGITGSNPSRFKGTQRPVEMVSWNDAVSFCKKARLRLPSEAEWEYSCRADSTTPFAFGRTITPLLVNCDGKHTTDVASFKPNAFGLFDVHGNVMEWCLDSWHDNYKGAPLDSSAWGAELVRSRSTWGVERVYRGGSWNHLSEYCRSAARSRAVPDLRRRFLGFRPTKSLP